MSIELLVLLRFFFSQGSIRDRRKMSAGCEAQRTHSCDGKTTIFRFAKTEKSTRNGGKQRAYVAKEKKREEETLLSSWAH